MFLTFLNHYDNNIVVSNPYRQKITYYDIILCERGVWDAGKKN